MGIEIFERAAAARGRILRVEQHVPAGDSARPGRAPGWLLTFDVGRILVRVDPARGCLEVRELRDLDELAGQTIARDEDEPWWRVAGNPITRVWPGPSGSGAEGGEGELTDVRLQFREDDENPKVISLRHTQDGVRVAVEEATDG